MTFHSSPATASTRLRIAIVLNRFYPEIGGAEINLYFQATELARRHEVDIYTPHRLRETSQQETVNGFRVFRLNDWRNLRRRFPNTRRDTLIPGVFFRILFGHYDVVQVFPSLHLNTVLAFFAAKLRRIPFILCSFDLLDYAQIERETGKIDPKIIKSYQPSRIKRFLFAHCDHIFAISGREMEFFRRYNPSVSFSPVPINTEEYTAPVPDVRARYGIAAEAMLFLVLGRVSRLKGQDLAVKAFLKAAPAMPGSQLVLVGRTDFEPEIAEQAQHDAEAAGAGNRVRFTGMIAREEVTAFLQQSDIHVVPVRFMNSGAVVVESWAAGTPVIQSDSVDPNLVEPGVNGYLFPSEDIDALAARMKQAFAEREKLPTMGKAGTALVLKEFTYPHLCDLYDAEYHRLCDRKGN